MPRVGFPAGLENALPGTGETLTAAQQAALTGITLTSDYDLPAASSLTLTNPMGGAAYTADDVANASGIPEHILIAQVSTGNDDFFASATEAITGTTFVMSFDVPMGVDSATAGGAFIGACMMNAGGTILQLAGLANESGLWHPALWYVTDRLAAATDDTDGAVKFPVSPGTRVWVKIEKASHFPAFIAIGPELPTDDEWTSLGTSTGTFTATKCGAANNGNSVTVTPTYLQRIFAWNQGA